MKRFFQIIIVTCFLAGFTVSAHAQRKPHRTAGARAAYGESTSKFKAHKKKSKKDKKKARKAVKQKGAKNEKASYWSGKPF